ncbi:LysR family transcriptional regulator [Telmatospirillum siberiense]|uniref:LysR family transcriptional regulator n=1 Tax=Telmatospirillum siberiense TaxID=382514 RepID=A0A2N3PUI7_9PROT|nr:LysR family transcriptional regulator [Telmatospirillum siberiense]PKU24063.1 LysR family transcriptional regulator [Telmatospirillum siberiense]
MDWEDLRHFAAFVVGGSLSGAARRLSVEHATVARRIATLEEGLGIKLVDRRGRRLMLTPDGERVAAIAERMARETEGLSRLAQGARSELKGEVVISAPSAYAAALLARPLVALQRRHPDLRIRLLGEARLVSLEHREADIAIRLSRPEAGDLTAVKLGEMPFHLYADAAYLKETAAADWRFVGADGAMAGSPQQVLAEKIAAGRNFGLASDHAEIQLAFVRAGGGVAMLPDFMALSEPGLVRASPGEPALRREVWLVVHSDVKAAAPIRATVDCLKSHIGKHLEP